MTEGFGIVGGSGSGKSVLLRTLLGLQRPQAGSVWIDGREVLVQGSAHGERVAAVAHVDGATMTLTWSRPNRRIAPGQTVVLYDPSDIFVLGGGIVTG